MTEHDPSDRSEPLPYFKWWWRDWRANRRVQRMPWAARGIYRELLDEQWAEGSLSPDLAVLADVVGCTPEDMADWWSYIAPCFAVGPDGRLRNERLERERTTADRVRVARSQAGALGGRSRARACGEMKSETSDLSSDPIAEPVDAPPVLPLAGSGEQMSHSSTEHSHSHSHSQKTNAARAARDRASVQAVVDAWNAFAAELGWPRVQVVSETRKRAVLARLREAGWREALPDAFAFLRASTWHAENPIGFDTFLRPGRVLQYAEKGRAGVGATTRGGIRGALDRSAAAAAVTPTAGGSDARAHAGAAGVEDLL